MNRWREEKMFRACVCSVALLLLAVPVIASAALGGDAASVQEDQKQTRGSLRMAVRGGERFVVHELQAPSGTVVRQYAAPDGNVFGVAWQGPSMPDLRQVLGGYFPQYVEAAKSRRARGPFFIQQPELVMRSGGHMRAFRGHAYDPRMLPEGVAPEEIQ